MDEDLFESWIKGELGENADLSKDSSGMYADSAVQLAFRAWESSSRTYQKCVAFAKVGSYLNLFRTAEDARLWMKSQDYHSICVVAWIDEVTIRKMTP